jgi:thymidylate synthase
MPEITKINSVDAVWQTALQLAVASQETIQGRNGEVLSLPPQKFFISCKAGAFPLVTIKKMPFKSIAAEMCGFLKGAQTTQEFKALGTSVWEKNSEAWPNKKFPGDLGKIYGAQWRRFGGKFDQIEALIKGLRLDPYGRRHVVTAWNPIDLPEMALPPCPVLFQCLLRPGSLTQIKKLTLVVYQRSMDLFLGAPFDFAGYGLLMWLICKELGQCTPEALIFFVADPHLYKEHIEVAKTALSLPSFSSPKLLVTESIFSADLAPESFRLVDYFHGPVLQAKMVV